MTTRWTVALFSLHKCTRNLIKLSSCILFCTLVVLVRTQNPFAAHNKTDFSTLSELLTGKKNVSTMIKLNSVMLSKARDKIRENKILS